MISIENEGNKFSNKVAFASMSDSQCLGEFEWKIMTRTMSNYWRRRKSHLARDALPSLDRLNRADLFFVWVAAGCKIATVLSSRNESN